MLALAISTEKDSYTNKILKKSNLYKCMSDDFTFKTHVNLLRSMLSRTFSVMFNVKQLFSKNYPLLFNSFEVIHSESLKVSKSYKNNQVTSIKI